MTNQQLELGFGGARIYASATRRQERTTRARWWFAKMRQAVDNAFDWQPAPEPRPDQMWIPGSHRQVEV